MGKKIQKWETTKTVGEILKETREEKGFSLRDIADGTNIRLNFIEVIEHNDFEKLPSKIHINGFISVYAQFLGIDPNDILLHLQKQEMLNQDTPMEELFAINKDQFLKNHKKLIIIISSALLSVIFLIFLLKVIFSSGSDSDSVSILSDSNPSMTVALKEGDKFQFSMNNKVFQYTVLDFNDQTIVLRYEENNERFYMLSHEVLKHDFDTNYEYDYQLKKEKIVGNTLYLNISKIKDLRTEFQSIFSTFLDNSMKNISKDQIVLINNSDKPISFYLINVNGSEQEMTVKPNSNLSLPIMKDARQSVKTLYLSELADLSITINGESLKKEVFQKGMVGYLDIDFVNPLDINTMTYNLYF